MSPKILFFSSLGAAIVFGTSALALDPPGPGPEVTQAPVIETPTKENEHPPEEILKNEQIPETAPPKEIIRK